MSTSKYIGEGLTRLRFDKLRARSQSQGETKAEVSTPVYISQSRPFNNSRCHNLNSIVTGLIFLLIVAPLGLRFYGCSLPGLNKIPSCRRPRVTVSNPESYVDKVLKIDALTQLLRMEDDVINMSVGLGHESATLLALLEKGCRTIGNTVNSVKGIKSKKAKELEHLLRDVLLQLKTSFNTIELLSEDANMTLKQLFNASEAAVRPTVSPTREKTNVTPNDQTHVHEAHTIRLKNAYQIIRQETESILSRLLHRVSTTRGAVSEVIRRVQEIMALSIEKKAVEKITFLANLRMLISTDVINQEKIEEAGSFIAELMDQLQDIDVSVNLAVKLLESDISTLAKLGDNLVVEFLPKDYIRVEAHLRRQYRGLGRLVKGKGDSYVFKKKCISAI